MRARGSEGSGKSMEVKRDEFSAKGAEVAEGINVGASEGHLGGSTLAAQWRSLTAMKGPIPSGQG